MARAARKVAKKALRAEAPASAEGLPVKVVIDLEDGSDPYYANYAEVSAGQYDVEIIFARVPAKPSSHQLEGARASGELVVPAGLRVVLPHTVLVGLRDAISAQIAAFEERKI